ncbi:MAG TPA: class II glutamine amidotransferase [Gaiellales bacterium]|nr:class II glutamine amidotransferase [Gaiellales bacterium]
MCRLLAHVSRRPLTVAEAVGEADLAAFGDLSPRHPDGWGMAWWPSPDAAADGATPERRRAVGSARENPAFTGTMRGVAGCANVVHLRGATPGLTIELENCHPFVRPGAAFAQNGAIHPQHLLPELLPAGLEGQVEGSTDSERLFLYLYDRLEDGGPFADVVRDALAELLERFTSPVLNSMYLTPDHLHVLNAHNPTALPYPGDPHDLFALRFRVEDDLVVVASSGFDQPESRGWHTLDNMTILTVALDTLELRIDALDGVPVPAYDYSESA